MLTVAVPTHTRAAMLRQTREALTRPEAADESGWELIVVQNDCSDDTSTVLEDFASRLPLRALSEPRAGVNFARNAAVDAARGDYIIFTDDDTLPVPQWLCAYAAAFAAHPGADIFGGPIQPRFTGAPPAWLEDVLPEVASAYGRLESRGRGERLSQDFFPFGANMAFALRVLRKWPFDPKLGPRGKSRINGSETELILKLFANGHEGRWVESARVEHCIQPKQMTTDFIRWYFRGQGASMEIEAPPGTRMLWGRPRWLWREAVEAEVRYRMGRARGRPNEWIRDLKRASVARGRLTRRGSEFS
jgi:glycosyltransferase involved in cell wall biosynthesis